MSLFCHQCGAENADSATSCTSCGTSLNNPFQAGTVGGGSLPPGSIPNYLVQSILVTLCCCLPFGIVGIVYAAQVNGFLRAGDMAGAKKASDNARLWCWIGLGSGIALDLLVLGFYALMIIGMMASQQMPPP
ncbi:MAG: CD225/dispanin family protein [Pirellulales bacterium]